MDLNDIETKITLYAKEVEAPVEAGQVMGIMTLSYNGEVYGQLDLVAVTSVERSELLYKKQQFFQFFQNEGVRIILAVVLFLTAIVILKLTVFRRKRRPKAGAAARRGNYKGTRM
jgi:D-alanyl-D-alanine carboxypeptidase (penicillin-binding protein 5/6)